MSFSPNVGGRDAPTPPDLPSFQTFLSKTEKFLSKDFLVRREGDGFDLSTPAGVLLGSLKVFPILPHPVEKRYCRDGWEFLTGPIGFTFYPVGPIPSFNLGGFASGVAKMNLLMREVGESFGTREFLFWGRSPEEFLPFQEEEFRGLLQQHPFLKGISVGQTERIVPTLSTSETEWRDALDRIGWEPDRYYSFRETCEGGRKFQVRVQAGPTIQVTRLD